MAFFSSASFPSLLPLPLTLPWPKMIAQSCFLTLHILRLLFMASAVIPMLMLLICLSDLQELMPQPFFSVVCVSTCMLPGSLISTSSRRKLPFSLYSSLWYHQYLQVKAYSHLPSLPALHPPHSIIGLVLTSLVLNLSNPTVSAVVQTHIICPIMATVAS